MGHDMARRSTICCMARSLVFVVLWGGAWQEVRRRGMARFVASLVFVVVSGHGKKYELLPVVFVVLCGHGKKYDLLPLVFVAVSGHGKKLCRNMPRSTICCL